MHELPLTRLIMESIYVTQIMRRPDRDAHSIEELFDTIDAAMPSDVKVKREVAPFLSRGVLRRILNGAWCGFRQGHIVHVTGDIHYVCLFLRGRKVILTAHDCGTLDRSRGLRRALLGILWFRLPAYLAGKITVVSEATKRELLRYTGVPDTKVVVIPNCVSPQFTHSPATFNSNRPSLLQVGTGANKNLLRIAEALQGVACRLHIVGHLPQATTEALNRNSVEFTSSAGETPHGMVRRYQEADIVMFASTYEGFGMPILEAQATGRPVVTSDRSPMREVAGRGACLVDPHNVQSIRRGILQVTVDSGFRNQIVQAGFENARLYSPIEIAAQYAAVYRGLAGEFPAPNVATEKSK